MTIKWKYEFKPQPSVGDQRIVTKFLLFPKWLDNEFRWLGRERILQEWAVRMRPGPAAPVPCVAWRDKHWLD